MPWLCLDLRRHESLQFKIFFSLFWAIFKALHSYCNNCVFLCLLMNFNRKIWDEIYSLMKYILALNLVTWAIKSTTSEQCIFHQAILGLYCAVNAWTMFGLHYILKVITGLYEWRHGEVVFAVSFPWPVRHTIIPALFLQLVAWWLRSHVPPLAAGCSAQVWQCHCTNPSCLPNFSSQFISAP